MLPGTETSLQRPAVHDGVQHLLLSQPMLPVANRVDEKQILVVLLWSSLLTWTTMTQAELHVSEKDHLRPSHAICDYHLKLQAKVSFANNETAHVVGREAPDGSWNATRTAMDTGVQ